MSVGTGDFQNPQGLPGQTAVQPAEGGGFRTLLGQLGLAFSEMGGELAKLLDPEGQPDPAKMAIARSKVAQIQSQMGRPQMSDGGVDLNPEPGRPQPAPGTVDALTRR